MKKALIGNALLICSLSLIALSIYVIHYLIFGNAGQTISGLVLSLAYVPIGMLYEILLLDKILEQKEKLSSAKRMNLVIGSFYHEIGNDLIKHISKGDLSVIDSLCYNKIKDGCKEDKAYSLFDNIENYECNIDISKIDLKAIYQILERRDTFVLGLVTNSSIDIYDGFIEMLMSLIHLRDELQLRYMDKHDNSKDEYHIESDLCMCYLRLLDEWIKYMKELKEFYPKLYLKISKKSPFSKV